MATTAAANHKVMTHSVTVDAPPDTVFNLIADVTEWPHMFGPTVHVEVPESAGDEQVLEIWAVGGGRVRHWTSRRRLDRAAGTIGFRQIVPASPVASMGGVWRVAPTADGGTRVVLEHDFRAIDDDPAAEALITEAVDRNSNAELAALKATAELGAGRSDLQVTFRDSVDINGSVEEIFGFLDQAGQWADRLPHVARSELTEEASGVQLLEMDTRTPDGDVHTTRSVRVSFPNRNLIVYKQLVLPEAMRGHTGRWELRSEGGRVTATSWHTVTLDPAGVRALLGESTPLAVARDKVRNALGTNSLTTLRHAAAFAEARTRD